MKIKPYVLKKIVLLAVLLSVAACSNVKPTEETMVSTATIAEREARLAAFSPWRALGSIAVESEKQGKFNASFSWETNSQGYDIKLFGPLGVQAFHLIENNTGAQLIDRKGQVSGDTADQLLNAVLGVPVPISKMQTWAVGLPGNAIQIQRDNMGRISSMVVAENESFKWNVDFKHYTNVDGLDLPKAVHVDSDDIQIRLSFKKWLRTGATNNNNNRLVIPGIDT